MLCRIFLFKPLSVLAQAAYMHSGRQCAGRKYCCPPCFVSAHHTERAKKCCTIPSQASYLPWAPSADLHTGPVSSVLLLHSQNTARTVILSFGNRTHDNGIRIPIFCGHLYTVALLFAKHCAAERCIAADAALQRIAPYAGHDLSPSSSKYSSTLSNSPTSSAADVSSITRAFLIMRSR